MQSAKRQWLVTYGAAGQSITREMMLQHNVAVDECYTLNQRDLKYTLINVPKRVRANIMATLMDAFESTYHIVRQEIIGYDAISSNSNGENHIEAHPGFKLIVEHLNTHSPLLEQWPESPKRNGLLWRHWIHAEPAYLGRHDLIRELISSRQGHEAERKARQETQDQIDVLTAQAEEFRRQNKRLCRENEELKGTVKALRAFLSKPSV